jgi:hypothetical protein
MLIKYLIFLLCLTIAPNILAQSTCANSPAADKKTKNIDLRSEMSPLRDQDSIGWCYGFTAADLLTHYLYKTEASEVKNPVKNADYRSRKYSVSAVGVAVRYNNRYKSHYFDNIVALNSAELGIKYRDYKANPKGVPMTVVPEGGSIYKALLMAKLNGFCFEKDLPSENFSYSKDSLCGKNSKCNLEEMLMNLFDETDKNSCTVNPGIQKLFPTLTAKAIKSILLISEKENSLKNLAAVACHEKFTTNFFTESEPIFKNIISRDSSTPEYDEKAKMQAGRQLLQSADAVLDKGTPVGISYCSAFLLKANPKAKECGPHASSLVGKRFNSKSCEVEYILRNSWGPNCDIYNTENPKYSNCIKATRDLTEAKDIYRKNRECRISYPPIPRNPRVKCDADSGYVYIKKSDFVKTILNVTYIQE